MYINRLIRLVLFVFLLSANGLNAQTQQPLRIGSLVTRAGEKKSGYIHISTGTKGPEIKIPFTVANGTIYGPVLTVAVNVHESNNPLTYALQNLRDSIDPSQLKGAVIFVQTVQSKSFLRRTIYYNPFEGLNLKRIYPGKVSGNLSERIAYQISKDVIGQSDFFIDMHNKDPDDDPIPYLYCVESGNPFVVVQSKELAKNFGARVIVDENYKPKDASASISLGNKEYSNGKPNITVEYGLIGEADDEKIASIVDGVRNIMKHLGMINETPQKMKQPTWISGVTLIRSNYYGIFHPLVQAETNVLNGSIIGYVKDSDGNILEEIKAPHFGIVLFVMEASLLHKGFPLISIGNY